MGVLRDQMIRELRLRRTRLPRRRPPGRRIRLAKHFRIAPDQLSARQSRITCFT